MTTNIEENSETKCNHNDLLIIPKTKNDKVVIGVMCRSCRKDLFDALCLRLPKSVAYPFLQAMRPKKMTIDAKNWLKKHNIVVEE